ncbi:unnamed protein product [Mytilus edulis]|uniref:Uncharacterized protein n=1 Tax=Mytilus edulis TaxID=6550 RepID=A0A8S3R3V2_MYTED|nr:unnamed protein product [Mytilus edulis]
MLFRILILFHACVAFPFKCPEPAQWSLRARSHCPDPSKYFCLKNDLINDYSENCTVIDFLQPGRKHVLRGGLDADICSSERYQPWPMTFYTNVSTNCIFLKSLCKEEGQVVNENGNRNTDTTCKCDYTKGYDFLVKPRNPCFCVPLEEDYSCYLKTCIDSTFKISPAKYNIPLEIQKLNPSQKDRYIKILLKEPIEDVKSTDGIDIARKSKVHIETKEWIFCQEDTTVDVNERIGRALRQTDISDNCDHQEKNAQNRQKTANLQINANAYEQTDGGNKT